MFNNEDLQQIARHGLTEEGVRRQIDNFVKGFPYLKVVRAASAGDGVRVLNGEEIARATARYDVESASLRLVKFVPASGAATRMFKELFEFVNEGKRGSGIDTLMTNIKRFAFWPELEHFINNKSTDEEIVSAIVKHGLAYGSKPKGLVTFHAYSDGNRKAIEEHMVEGATYACSGDEVYIHFTVSEEHMGGFWDVLGSTQPFYEEQFGVKYNVSFSVQKPSTDTIAVNPDNTPFRDANGRLLFRPAGHGALIENLNDIDADVIFVKNIDNVTTDARRGDTIKYKKALAGVLLELQEQIFACLKAIDSDRADVEQIAKFVEDKLCIKLPSDCDVQMLRRLLDRPIRVCGVVRNQGEPGGGPFWVVGEGGAESLQIAESSQIAPEDMHLMQSATHFNPVDLVCGVKRVDGSKFDLTQYTDPSTGFISSKSSGGRELRAQELPGLWNGAMANWNTVFVEVPVTTFSPVKVVLDLLRAEHQPE